MTCDVEEHSIQMNTLDDGVIPLVHDVGLPRLISLFDKHNIKATFFFTGYYATKSPESLSLVKQYGHEVGCHSFSHEPKMALDKLSYREQVKELAKAKFIIESIVGKIVSFRAPALRTNRFTVDALVKTGFTHDSSMSPRRFDGPLSSGFREKLKWLKSKEGVHFMYPIKGNKLNKIIEVPISANFLPYIGTLSRISPNIMDILRNSIFERSIKYNLPVVFDTHPNECVDIIGKPVTNRRSKNFLRYVFSDLIRHKMKIQNLGKPAIKLLEKEIVLAKERGFKFKTISEMQPV